MLSREGKVDDMVPTTRKKAANWHFDARHFQGGYMRWSEVSSVEDDEERMQCLHYSRRLCSQVREKWSKCIACTKSRKRLSVYLSVWLITENMVMTHYT